MSDPTPHGPVDVIVLEFPAGEPTGDAADELLALVDSGTIRLLDLLVVHKDQDGTVAALDIAGDGLTSFGVFSGAQSGLVGDDDLDAAGEVLEPGTTAAVIVFENTWAVPFISAAMAAGGQAVASMRIPADEVIAALDELDETQPVT